MRRAAVTALVLLGACATDPMSAYYTNTVLVTQPYGETDRILLSRDHSYVMYGVRFPEGHGVWSIEDGAVCLSPADTPETAGQKFCNAWSGRRAGDQWTIQVGEYQIAMSLAPGRLGPITQPAS